MVVPKSHGYIIWIVCSTTHDNILNWVQKNKYTPWKKLRVQHGYFFSSSRLLLQETQHRAKQRNPIQTFSIQTCIHDGTYAIIHPLWAEIDQMCFWFNQRRRRRRRKFYIFDGKMMIWFFFFVYHMSLYKRKLVYSHLFDFQSVHFIDKCHRIVSNMLYLLDNLNWNAYLPNGSPSHSPPLTMFEWCCYFGVRALDCISTIMCYVHMHICWAGRMIRTNNNSEKKDTDGIPFILILYYWKIL